VGKFMDGYNTPIEEIRRKEVQRSKTWIRIGWTLLIGIIAILLLGGLSIFIGNHMP